MDLSSAQSLKSLRDITLQNRMADGQVMLFLLNLSVLGLLTMTAKIAAYGFAKYSVCLAYFFSRFVDF